MPAFAVIDTHVHFWDTDRLTYDWLSGEPLLNKPLLPGDYEEATGAVDVDGLVFVQADCADAEGLAEARWVAQLAEENPVIQAIVAHAALEEGDGVRGHLEQLQEMSLVKGVRRLLQDEHDHEFCLRPDFVKGVRALADYDLRFDLCVRHYQLRAVRELVARCPNVRFMLDHIGKPDIRGREMMPWGEDIRRLAELPNVACKLSGLITEADFKQWRREDLRPYIDHVIEQFGLMRVCYGSDWPVQRLAGTYESWVGALDWAVEEYTEEERRRLYRRNGAQFYDL